MLKGRYDALRTRYESDMRRLTFVAEADIHRDSIQKLDHCPFCNGELPKEKTKSCLEAAIAEADKIEMRIRDIRCSMLTARWCMNRKWRSRGFTLGEYPQLSDLCR